jgi:hypothetical protein
MDCPDFPKIAQGLTYIYLKFQLPGPRPDGALLFSMVAIVNTRKPLHLIRCNLALTIYFIKKIYSTGHYAPFFC